MRDPQFHLSDGISVAGGSLHARSGDTVRFIGADTLCTVREYNTETLEYRVQRCGEHASSRTRNNFRLSWLECATGTPRDRRL